MCELEKERDKFTIEVARVTSEYISEVSAIRFEMTLQIHNGFLEPNDMDVYGIQLEAERKLKAAKKKLDEDTVFLIKEHFLY